jgi:UbiD family decarboxylase
VRRRSLAFLDLREFLGELRRDRELVTVDVEVDARLEAAEIHRRVIAAGGPALLFTRVRGARFPLVTNLFGTARRAERAFGPRPMALVRRMAEAARMLMPPTPSRLWRFRDLWALPLRIGTRRRRKGPVAEIACDPDLGALPILTCWPEDGGPFLTLPLVYTEHPEHGGHNLGIYRLQVYDSRTTGMHWQIGKGGGFHYAAAERLGRPLPVTVILGGPPALILSAVAPLPENIPELVLASLLMGRRLPIVKGIGPHPIPAMAEFVLLGHVPPKVRHAEGPFGDHYGYYSLRHDYPVFQIERMLHRQDAIYPATVVGKPRQEDFYIGDLLQELLSPLFPLVMPSVEALWSYGETGYHSLAAARVQERYHREAMMSAFRILGEGQLSLTKFLFVVDRPVDLRDFKKVLEHILSRTNPETDLYVLSNLSMDTLDYTGPAVNEGSKGVWLGLGEAVRELPADFGTEVRLPSGVSEVRVFCPGCLVIGGASRRADPSLVKEVVSHPAFQKWPLLVLTDEPGRAASSAVNFLWTTFTRFEPAADIHAAGMRVVRNHVSYRAPILIDARIKPDFPEELHCSQETAELVDRRWLQYFPEGMEMGDSDLAHLDRPPE